MPIEQLFFTHCDATSSLYGDEGFRARAASPGVSRADVDLLGTHMAYALPKGFAGPLTQDRAPLRLALTDIRGQYRVLIHSAYVELDSRGRDKNYFSHALVRLPAEVHPRDAACLWGADADGCWTKRDGPHPKKLPALEQMPQPGTLIGDEALHDLLVDAPRPILGAVANLAVCPPRVCTLPTQVRRDYVRYLLHWCLATLTGSTEPPPRLVVCAEPGLMALLIYAGTRLLPRNFTRNLTFSTYEGDITKGRTALIGTIPADRLTQDLSDNRSTQELSDDVYAGVTFGSAAQSYGLNTFTGKRSAPPKCPCPTYADLAIRWAASGPDEWAKLDDLLRVLEGTGDRPDPAVFEDAAQIAVKLEQDPQAGKQTFAAADLTRYAAQPVLTEVFCSYPGARRRIILEAVDDAGFRANGFPGFVQRLNGSREWPDELREYLITDLANDALRRDDVPRARIACKEVAPLLAGHSDAAAQQALMRVLPVPGTPEAGAWPAWPTRLFVLERCEEVAREAKWDRKLIAAWYSAAPSELDALCKAPGLDDVWKGKAVARHLLGQEEAVQCLLDEPNRRIAIEALRFLLRSWEHGGRNPEQLRRYGEAIAKGQKGLELFLDILPLVPISPPEVAELLFEPHCQQPEIDWVGVLASPKYGRVLSERLSLTSPHFAPVVGRCLTALTDKCLVEANPEAGVLRLLESANRGGKLALPPGSQQKLYAWLSLRNFLENETEPLDEGPVNSLPSWVSALGGSPGTAGATEPLSGDTVRRLTTVLVRRAYETESYDIWYAVAHLYKGFGQSGADWIRGFLATCEARHGANEMARRRCQAWIIAIGLVMPNEVFGVVESYVRRLSPLEVAAADRLIRTSVHDHGQTRKEWEAVKPTFFWERTSVRLLLCGLALFALHYEWLVLQLTKQVPKLGSQDTLFAALAAAAVGVVCYYAVLAPMFRGMISACAFAIVLLTILLGGAFYLVAIGGTVKPAFPWALGAVAAAGGSIAAALLCMPYAWLSRRGRDEERPRPRMSARHPGAGGDMWAAMHRGR